MWKVNKPEQAEGERGAGDPAETGRRQSHGPQFPTELAKTLTQDREVAPVGGALGPSGRRFAGPPSSWNGCLA